MKQREIIKLLYIDDDIDEAISEYLEDDYKNERYEIEYKQISFDGEQGYESLLESPLVSTSNVILIDSRLFENDRISSGKFSGEEFRIILEKKARLSEAILFLIRKRNQLI